MTTDYHTEFGVNDTVDISEVNTRLADLDEAIGDNAAAAVVLKAARVFDQKATTTDGGAASATTWEQRDLNQETDPDSIVSVASNEFTPISGDYVIIVHAPAYKVGLNRLRLYNVTQTSVTAYGVNASVSTASTGNQAVAVLKAILSANGTDAYRIDHYTTSAEATDGLGQAVGDGASEIYTDILLIKIG